MEYPAVSVVIPTVAPRADYLERALESVRRQDYPGEVRIIVELDTTRGGATETRNRGLAQVKTPWVAFVDDDDEILPNHISLCMSAALENNVDLVYSWFNQPEYNWDGLAINEKPAFGHPFDEEAKQWLLTKANFIPVTVLARTELMHKVGGFSPVPWAKPDNLCEDWGCWIKLIESGAKFYHLPKKTWVWHHWAGNTSGQSDRVKEIPKVNSAKVNVIYMDDDASAKYRLLWPAQALKDQGASIEIYDVIDKNDRQMGDYETIVFNRPVRKGMSELVKGYKEHGKRVVVDIDDAYELIPKNHAAFGGKEAVELHACAKAADAVVVTTPALLELYGYGHGVVVPNFIPKANLSVVREQAHEHENNLWVGWYGSLGAHPNDPATTRDGVAKAINQNENAVFTFIGPETQQAQALLAFGNPKRYQFGPFVTLEYLATAISAFDIGIVPLEPSKFNDCKSWLKGLEMISAGVPLIASSTPEYRRLNSLGAGILSSTYEWYRHTKKLLDNSELRIELSMKGREVASNLTIEGNCNQFWSAWVGE